MGTLCDNDGKDSNEYVHNTLSTFDGAFVTRRGFCTLFLIYFIIWETHTHTHTHTHSHCTVFWR